ncbi:unnamed protein product [Sphagnum jensenii]|uniref:Uncharacterized protein n=1 Tax=Sphagnum jensenii TaxID=128206 RepID=A0ABP1BYP1_9BRYO
MSGQVTPSPKVETNPFHIGCPRPTSVFSWLNLFFGIVIAIYIVYTRWSLYKHRRTARCTLVSFGEGWVAVGMGVVVSANNYAVACDDAQNLLVGMGAAACAMISTQWIYYIHSLDAKMRRATVLTTIGIVLVAAVQLGICAGSVAPGILGVLAATAGSLLAFFVVLHAGYTVMISWPTAVVLYQMYKDTGTPLDSEHMGTGLFDKTYFAITCEAFYRHRRRAEHWAACVPRRHTHHECNFEDHEHHTQEPDWIRAIRLYEVTGDMLDGSTYNQYNCVAVAIMSDWVTASTYTLFVALSTTTLNRDTFSDLGTVFMLVLVGFVTVFAGVLQCATSIARLKAGITVDAINLTIGKKVHSQLIRKLKQHKVKRVSFFQLMEARVYVLRKMLIKKKRQSTREIVIMNRQDLITHSIRWTRRKIERVIELQRGVGANHQGYQLLLLPAKLVQMISYVSVIPMVIIAHIIDMAVGFQRQVDLGKRHTLSYPRHAEIVHMLEWATELANVPCQQWEILLKVFYQLSLCVDEIRDGIQNVRRLLRPYCSHNPALTDKVIDVIVEAASEGWSLRNCKYKSIRAIGVAVLELLQNVGLDVETGQINQVPRIRNDHPSETVQYSEELSSASQQPPGTNACLASVDDLRFSVLNDNEGSKIRVSKRFASQRAQPRRSVSAIMRTSDDPESSSDEESLSNSSDSDELPTDQPLVAGETD